ncbi:uncharacterized protein LOC111374320 [Olea europaea var. sylvestris]|uniref:uncharacterized protein LOC111374320 n=1 Tax=Olea europaea var. sylvestris TaxID=158386 RepID=UPI000C1CFE2F|nr:uncharacterized protein LOC111374320 [Olea europaea var. sylvestris]
MSPINDCMKESKFQWTPEAEKAFLIIKERPTSAPILALPDFTKPFALHYDASKLGIGAVLSQEGKPIAYFSQKLAGARGSDHEALKHLLNQESVSARHASWAGSSNHVADALSRWHGLLARLQVAVTGFETFVSLYADDPYFGPIYHSLLQGPHSSFLLEDCLRLKLIEEFHGEGHVGRDRTLALISASFSSLLCVVKWRSLSHDAGCTTWQRGKPQNAGLYRPLPVQLRGLILAWILSWV